MGLELLMSQGGTSEQRELSAESPATATFFGSRLASAVDGSSDSTESPCFRIGARIIQPPLLQ